MNTTPGQALLNAFGAAVAAARPEAAVAEAVRAMTRPVGRTVVVGGGKAAAGMALAFEEAWDTLSGPALSGVVVTPYGHVQQRPRHIAVLEAGHPEPDAAGVLAGARLLGAVRGLTPGDLVVALISGGGSALMVAPDGVTLGEKLQITRALLYSGADITEINAVRKGLSRIKGGRLALAAAPARVVSLIVSDVVGDDLSAIASGPTVPNTSSPQAALAVLQRYGTDLPAAGRHLREQARAPAPTHQVRGEAHLIVTNATALAAARTELQRAGYLASVWSDSVTGEARDAARLHARQARTLGPGEVLLSGGETTVTVRGTGQGGRNCEFLLALATELGPGAGLYALACDTDGIDGVSNDGENKAAGALLTPDTLERAARLGLDARRMLGNNDAASFFAALGDLVVVGPTGTNVNDFRAILRPIEDTAALQTSGDRPLTG